MRIAVCGPIGVGKSTLSKQLSKLTNLKLADESVDNNPFLDLFYKDAKRWGFTVQMHFLEDRFKAIQEDDIILDRVIHEDVLFAKNSLEQGLMTQDEYDLYERLFVSLVNSSPTVDYLIYLSGSPEHIISNIVKRGRISELDTPMSYFINLQQKYDNWVEKFKKYNPDSKVIILSIDDFDSLNSDDVKELINTKLSLKK